MIAKEKKRFFIQTFGCQMNVNDSERLSGLLRSQGFEVASDAASADFVFLNTCAVREKAATKLDHSLARLRHLKRRRPELQIGVGGCVAQMDGTGVLARAPHVDLLVGTHNLHRVPELLARVGAGSTPEVDLDRKANPFAIPGPLVAHSNPVRAYVTAIEGCNHVCSFCVVPRTRGPEVHRPVAEIVSETASLVARGFPEVMLLGQTVNAYRDGDVGFAGLLERVHDVEGLQRLRFTTSHPEHVDASMVGVLRDLERLCPYLHLPFQSGSDRILASMRRGYTREAYLATVDRLRDAVPDLALTTDVIVGYPGETEAEFEATMSVLDRVDFDGVFAFTYSPRPGTTAARLEDDVPESEKKRRFQRLNDRQQERQRRRNAALIGQRQEVLVESVDAPGRVSGRTPHFQIVHLDGGAELVGRMIPAEITGSGPNALQGRLSQDVH